MVIVRNESELELGADSGPPGHADFEEFYSACFHSLTVQLYAYTNDLPTALAALLVVGPVAAYAAVNGEPPGPPAQTAASQDASGSASTSPSAEPTPSASPSPTSSASATTAVPAVAGKVFYQYLSTGALVVGGKRYAGGGTPC